MATIMPGAPTEYGQRSGSFSSQTGNWFLNVSRAVAGARWASLNVDKNAEIVSATFTPDFLGYSAPVGFGIVQVDNATSLTGTYWLSGTDYGSVGPSGSGSGVVPLDFTSQIQSLVNRAGWVNGNSFALRSNQAGTWSIKQASLGSFTVVTASASDAGEDQTVEPWEIVTLTGTPSGSTWEQVSGESVTLGGSGATRTFVAPAKMVEHQMVFSYGGSTMTVTVSPAKHAIIGAGSTLIPARFITI